MFRLVRAMAQPGLALAMLGILASCNEVTAPPPRPVQPQALLVSRIGQLAVGNGFACVNGEVGVSCWGANVYGQTTPPAGLGIVKQVATGSFHTCAVKHDDTLSCWGDNTYGESTVASYLGTVKQVSAGYTYTCAIKSDDTLTCWGSTAFGHNNVPADLGTVKAVVGSWYHTCAIKTDDTLACWGRNDFTQSTVPADLGTVKQVVTGVTHTCVIKSDDSVACWGNNGSGQSSVPADLGSAKLLAAGNYHSCAIKSDDTLVCWGYNTYGEIAVPADLGPVASVAAGYYDTCVIKSDGFLACWGNVSSVVTDVPNLSTHYAPAATFSAPATVVTTTSFTVSLDNAQVVTSSGPISASDAVIQYAFDCGDGSGFSAFSSTSSTSCTAGTAGSQTVKGKLKDKDNDQQVYAATVTVLANAAPATLVAVLATPPQIGLTWSATTGQSGYELQRRTRNGDGTWAAWYLLTNAAAGATTYQDGSGATDLVYQYRVRSCYLSTCSVWKTSNTVAADMKPASASNISGVTISPAEIDVAWTTPASNQSSLLLQRRSHAGSWGAWTPIASPAALATSYRDTTVAEDTRYEYRIAACNVAGCSAWSTSSPIVAQTTIPDAPTDLSVSVISATRLDVVWTETSGNVSRFEVQRRDRPVGGTFGPWSSPVIVTSASYSDTSTTGAMTYMYRARACNALGCSPSVSGPRVTTP